MGSAGASSNSASWLIFLALLLFSFEVEQKGAIPSPVHSVFSSEKYSRRAQAFAFGLPFLQGKELSNLLEMRIGLLCLKYQLLSVFQLLL